MESHELQAVTAAVERVQALEVQIKIAIELLKGLEQARNDMMLDEIPSLFMSAGMSLCELKNGTKVEVRPEVGGAFPKVAWEEAAALLSEKGGEELLSTIVTLNLQGEKEERLIGWIREFTEEYGIRTKVSRGVHSQTYRAWMRTELGYGRKNSLTEEERSEAQERYPHEDLRAMGLHLFSKTTIKTQKD